MTRLSDRLDKFINARVDEKKRADNSVSFLGKKVFKELAMEAERMSSGYDARVVVSKVDCVEGVGERAVLTLIGGDSRMVCNNLVKLFEGRSGIADVNLISEKNDFAHGVSVDIGEQ